MKKHLFKILGGLSLILVIFVAFHHVANAQTTALNLFGLSAFDLFNDFLAYTMNAGLKLMSWLMAIAGAILNFSMTLTLNIKAFVDKSPAIYTTWRALRDISGIFIIFFLLWAALQLIVGITKPDFGGLIKNIVLAGVLINFSFFFTGLGIDASNIISVQLYNAIAPSNSLAAASVGGAINLQQTLGDGGISNIFMNSLKIPKLYADSNSQASAFGSTAGTVSGKVNDSFKIAMIGLIGIIIEFTAAVSFGLAALAFIARFIILIFLLAFSPIFFISFLSDEVKTYAGKWWEIYKGMLLFMPVYLLLMYLALSVLTTTPMFDGSPPTAGEGWYQDYLLLAVNAFIVIFLLNLPLLAASSMLKGVPYLGDFMGSAYNKFRAANVWKNVGGGAVVAGAGAYRGTVGRAASKIAESEGFKDKASNNRIWAAALKGTRATATTYNKKLDEQVKARTEFGESLGADQRKVKAAQQEVRDIEHNISRANAAGSPKAFIDAMKGDLTKAKQAVSNVEQERKLQYANTVNSSSVDTLLMFTARKNKIGGAKLELDTLKKKMEFAEKLLTTKRDDIKESAGKLKRVEEQVAAMKMTPAVAAPIIAGLQAKLRTLSAEETELLNNTAGSGVNDIRARIDELSLIK